MPNRFLRLLLLIILAAFVSAPAIPVSSAHIRRAQHLQMSVPNPAMGVESAPLPGGCIRVIPPGEEEPTCCISGFVYIDGQIVAGAEVEIRTERDEQITLTTQGYSGSEALPHYRTSLNIPPINVQVGEHIFVTARYSGHERTINYQVQPGGQQVDVVLSRNQSDDVVVEREIWAQAAAGEFDYPSSLAVGTDGNVYVLDPDNTRVQVFDQNGVFIRQWGTPGNINGKLAVPQGIAVDASNNIYIADTGNHRIQKFNSSGGWLASWGSFGSASGQFSYPRGIAIDRQGNVFVADTGNRRVQKLASDGTRLLGWSNWGDTEEFGAPEEIAVDANDRVYVLDGLRIHKFNSSGQYISTVRQGYMTGFGGMAVDANGGVYTYHEFSGWITGPNDVWWDGDFDYVEGLALDGSGNLYVADTYNQRIQKFTVAGTWLKTWGRRGDAPGQIHAPGGIVVGSNNTLYITDQVTHRVQRLTRAGLALNVWGSQGSGQEQFNFPTGIAIAPDGTIYVVDTRNHRIQHFTAEGAWLNMWGSEGEAPGLFSWPEGIAVDPTGNVYVADTDNNRIQKFNADGVWLQSWTSSSPVSISIAGSRLYVGENQHVAVFEYNGQLIRRWDRASMAPLAVDAHGNVYSINSWEAGVTKYSNSGTVLGTWGAGGGGPGEFSRPEAIAVSTDGTIYIGDSGSHRVQAFQPMVFTRPIATIAHLSATTLDVGTTLVAYGLGQDSDETNHLSNYRWILDGTQQVGDASVLNLPTNNLPPGTHTLSFSVRDTEGQWSDVVATSFYVAAPAQAQWTMLLYLSGDYHDRNSQFDAFEKTIRSLGLFFRNPFVQIVAQIDGPADGDTQRLLIRPGTATRSPEITRLSIGERAMDNPDVLADFLRWGQSTFPAEHYYLAIADHGQAIQGISWDTTSDLRDGTLDDSAFLTPQELGLALRATNVAPIDILHLDACSMQLLEVAYETQTSTQIVIGSQYLGWDYFAYDLYASTIGASTQPREVAQSIITVYQSLAQADQLPHTISAMDLSRAEPTLTALNQLAAELTALVNNNLSYRSVLHTLWKTSQKYESNGDYENNDLDMYVDLLDWTEHVEQTVDNPAVQAWARKLRVELTGEQPFIISSKAQSNYLLPQYANGSYIDLSGSHGLSIFYPGQRNTIVFDRYINDQLFNFTKNSRWPDFLIAGVGPLTPGPLEPAPGPLPPLTPLQPAIFVPFVQR